MRRQRYLGRGQIAICQRSGIKCHASELVRDGRLTSLLVLPEWADPPQPQERPYVPDDAEGLPPFQPSPDQPPTTPPVLAGEALGDSNSLSWSAAEWIAGPRVDLYRVMRATPSGQFALIGTVTVEYTMFAGITGPALVFTDEDVVSGEEWRYKVVAVASGHTLTSNTITLELIGASFRILQEDGSFVTLEDDSGFALLEVAP